MRNSLNRYKPSTPEEREVVDNWMNVMGISHLSERKFSDLSSGEQRMVMLARALVKQPELLVLDEPLHGLDGEHKELVISIINGLVERNGSTLILVSHYENEYPDCITHTQQIGK